MPTVTVNGSRHAFALVQARAMGLALHERGFANHAAVRADRTIGPKAGFKPFAGLGFVVKDRI